MGDFVICFLVFLKNAQCIWSYNRMQKYTSLKRLPHSSCHRAFISKKPLENTCKVTLAIWSMPTFWQTFNPSIWNVTVWGGVNFFEFAWFYEIQDFAKEKDLITITWFRTHVFEIWNNQFECLKYKFDKKKHIEAGPGSKEMFLVANLPLCMLETITFHFHRSELNTCSCV